MKDMKDFEYLTYEHRDDHVVVHGWGRYGRGSVLEGQAKKSFLDSFETEAEAQAAYPTATCSSPLIQPQNTFNHLPDDGDGW